MNNKLKYLKNEAGEVFILVLLMLVVGALILTPLLANMRTDLKVGTTYENKANDFYAADSGVEDGLWQIKNDHIKTLIPSFDIYGFDKLGLHYVYPAPLNVNGKSVTVTIDNVWIPKDYTPTSMGLSLSDLHNIVENNRLAAAGSVSGTTQYKIALAYNYESSDPSLTVTQIGAWLPPGFTYNAGSCNLETLPLSDRPTLPPTISDYDGGTVVVWNWATPKPFSTLCTDLGIPTTPTTLNQKMDITLNYTPRTAGATPNLVSWVYTGAGPKPIRFAWDADLRVFKIDSISSGGTHVDAYGVKVEQRSLANTINGDYVAVGNSLVADTDSDGQDDTPITPAASVVGPSNQYANIPTDAEVSAAYLYWSGWYSTEASGAQANVDIAPLNPDGAANWNNWTHTGTAWSSDGSKFIGHFTSGGESAKYITKTTAINLSSYAGKTVTIAWQQWVTGAPDANDKLYLSISSDGGVTWSDGNVGITGTQCLVGNTAPTAQPAQANFSYTIPGTYLNANFKMRLYVQNFSAGARNCYVENIAVQETPLTDTCDTLTNWTNGGDWIVQNNANTGLQNAFQAHDTANTAQTSVSRYITLAAVRNLTAYNNQAVTLTLKQWGVVGGGSYSSNDKLYVSFSSNGGTTWSSATGILIAQGTGGTNFGTAAAPVSYSYTIPNAYVNTASLKIRFLVQYFQNSENAGRNCYIDNIQINTPAIFTDTCSNLNNWTVTGDWLIQNNASTGLQNAFQGQDLAGTASGDPTRYMTLTSAMNLSAYNNKIVEVSWQQWAAGTLSPSDALQFQFSNDGGSTWSGLYTSAQDDVQTDGNGNGGFKTTAVVFGMQIPNQYLTSNFKMRFYLAPGGFGPGEFCYVDNIYISNIPAVFYDAASYAPPNNLSLWTSDTDWKSYYNSQFTGIHTNGSYLTLSTSLDLSGAGQAVAVTWDQSYTGTLTSSDALQFEFSGDGGNTWSSPIDALDSSSSPAIYTKTIPSQYSTSNFKIRFYLLGFGAGKSCSIDDIKIYGNGLTADDNATFMINGTQVYFDNNDVPQQGAQKLVADRVQVINDVEQVNPGSSYSSFKDVTALVRAFTNAGPNGNRPGNGTYAVGDVDSDLYTNQAYRGWSLIIIYTNAATQGHQLYVYDTFLFAGNEHNFSPTQTDVDFDQNGTPGGAITGFLVPAQINGETYSAKITCFVGEGDAPLSGDYIALNGSKLWDGITLGDGTNTAANPNNVWNSQSLGMTTTGVGVDVDTFNIRWDSHILNAGDTSAQIDLVTSSDNWDLVYIVLSFRSQTTNGGAITYLIKNF